MPRFASTQLDLLLRGLVALEGDTDLIEAQLIHELEEDIATLIKQQRGVQAPLRWWEALNLSTALSSDQSQSHLVDQIKHLLDGVEQALMFCDPEQETLSIVYVNQAMCRLMGYERRELLGRNPRFLQGAHKDQVGVRLLQEAIRAKRSARVTLNNERKDGSTLLIELTITPLFDDHDQLSCWVGLLDDVTAKHQLQRELEEQRLLLEAIYNVTEVGICVTDEQGRYVEVNRAYCELYGYSRDELLGQDFCMILPPEHCEAARQAYQEHITEGEELPAEWVVHRKDGTPVEIFTTSRRLIYKDGRRFKVTTVADISAQKAQAKEREVMLLRQAQSQKLESIGMLTAGIAHDLNNIFAGLITNLGTLQSLRPHDAEASEILSDMEALMWRATDFIKTLAVSSGSPRQQEQRVNLSDFIDELWRLLVSALPSAHELLIQHQCTDIFVRLDVSQFQQVLMNLIINAFEASEGSEYKGAVTVMSSLRAVLATEQVEDLLTKSPVTPGLYAQICCMDRGVGIAPEHQAKIFDAFFSTKAQGRGLGLATVAGGIRHHHGALLLKSALRQGTSFEILLPLDLEPYQAPSKPRVLLIDDDPALLGALSRVLSVSGFEALSASSVAQGLRHDLRAQGKIDLALIDVIMPKQRGDALSMELRRRDPSLPIILMSGMARPAALQGDERCEFLPKPFDANNLLKTMKMMGVKAPRPRTIKPSGDAPRESS